MLCKRRGRRKAEKTCKERVGSILILGSSRPHPQGHLLVLLLHSNFSSAILFLYYLTPKSLLLSKAPLSPDTVQSAADPSQIQEKHSNKEKPSLKKQNQIKFIYQTKQTKNFKERGSERYEIRESASAVPRNKEAGVNNYTKK
jgi:hypothetical protein